MATVVINGKIKNLTYNFQQPKKLKVIPLSQFDINLYTSGLIETETEHDYVAFSRWKGPKRTRTYPFAALYDVFHFTGKIITIIPIIKDEGSSSGNNDRINFITLSWMNLANVYVILRWYDKAETHPTLENRITNQMIYHPWVQEKIKEILHYKLDAHHWNNEHFIRDFKFIYEEAVDSYEHISQQLSVSLHPAATHLSVLNQLLDENHPEFISLEKFAAYTLDRSRSAAIRETLTIHELERLEEGSIKAVFEMENNLGGKYYLTADDVFISDRELIIQEAKNCSGNLPSTPDIKDGLFKLILFHNVEQFTIQDKAIKHRIQLRLTGKTMRGNLVLPNSSSEIAQFIQQNIYSPSKAEIIHWLNAEAEANHFHILLGNQEAE